MQPGNPGNSVPGQAGTTSTSSNGVPAGRPDDPSRDASAAGEGARAKFWLETDQVSSSGSPDGEPVPPAQWRIDFSTFGPCGLRAQVTGTGSFKATLAYWSQILEETKRRRPACLLLIDELKGPSLTAGQWETLVGEMAGHGLERVRIAHVKPGGLDEVEYCEIFANEAGFESRVFVDERVAMLWLRYGGDEG